MGEKTGIQWTDHTFNPWWGCEKISPACKHCYAETFAKRVGLPLWGGDATERRFFGDKHWSEPLRWDKAAEKAGRRERVFCASMADVFEDREDLAPHRARLFRLVAETPALDWLLLTKRPENAARLWGAAAYEVNGYQGDVWPANVWLGATVENQEEADRRIPHLLATPAAVRFLSVEPMLGPIDFGVLLGGIDWMILGGESGPKARPLDLAWVRSAIAQCRAAGVAVFVKQFGEAWARESGTWREDRHGGSPEHWPEDLRVREWPVTR